MQNKYAKLNDMLYRLNHKDCGSIEYYCNRDSQWHDSVENHSSVYSFAEFITEDEAHEYMPEAFDI